MGDYAMTSWFELDLGDLGYREVEVEYWFSPGYPAKLYAPPENSYPAEEADVEISAMYLKVGEKNDNDPVRVNILPLIEKDALEKLQEQVYQSALEYETDRMVDMAEARYESWRDSQYD